MKKTFYLLSALMLLVTFGTAKEKQGQSSLSIEEKRTKILFENDLNKDGKLDAAEIDGMLKKKKERHLRMKKGMIDKYDTNKNGTLEEDERAKLKSDRLQNKK